MVIRQKEENEFLEEASAFFAASRRKYQDLADAMEEIISEDECNDTYGRILMYQALLLKQPEGVHIPGERTVYRVMDQIGLSHRPKSMYLRYSTAFSVLGLSMGTNINARCESMWARMKTEILYDPYDTRQMTVEELTALIWRYFLSYRNNRRICSANGGLPPMIKRRQYYEDLELVA